MKINYANKVSLNPIPTVNAINKVQDIDMNNIKNAVNENSSYIALQMPSQQAMDTAGQINFDISLTGTLETNDFIYVQFPASTTNLTSTISLNVNNSNIYPVIFGNGNAILSQVQNQALKLIFQGNSFVVYNEVYESVFPIGRGFIEFTDTDYSNYLGFTWQRELVGMVAVGLDTGDPDFNEIGKTGGSKYLQKHTHNIKWQAIGANGTAQAIIAYSGNDFATDSAGEGDSGNLQPYKVVAYWRRVA